MKNRNNFTLFLINETTYFLRIRPNIKNYCQNYCKNYCQKLGQTAQIMAFIFVILCYQCKQLRTQMQHC